MSLEKIQENINKNPIWDFFINAFSTMCAVSAQKQVQGRSPWHVPCGESGADLGNEIDRGDV